MGKHVSIRLKSMDLAWKLIGGAAALILAAAAVFSYLGKDAVLQEQELLARSAKNLDDTRARQVQADDSLKESTTARDEAEAERDRLAKAVEETNADWAEYTAEIAARKVDLDQIKKQVADIKEQVRQVGDIKKLIALVEGLDKQISDTEGDIDDRDQKLRIAVEKVEAVRSEIGEYVDLERRQRKAIVADDFTANVASVFPRWGFVLINKGNRHGVYANAELEIERGGERIGRLFVTRVEQDRSVASVVFDTWAEGALPQPGDKVVPAPLPENVTGDPVESVPVDGGGGAPPEPAPSSDPFGGGAPAAPSTDPFGGGAPAEPAAPSNDPFGGF